MSAAPAADRDAASREPAAPSPAFGFAALAGAVERRLVAALDLAPRALDPAHAHAAGTWKGAPVTITTAAYAGAPRDGRPHPVRHARVTRLAGADLDICNVLVLPHPVYALPILGADLVAASAARGLVVVDLSPTLGAAHAARLAALDGWRAAHDARVADRADDALPPTDDVPAWCAGWLSPWAVCARVTPAHAGAAARALHVAVDVFLALARDASPRPDLADPAAAGQAAYLDAHRTHDPAPTLLARMFGAPWTTRYVADVLYPSQWTTR